MVKVKRNLFAELKQGLDDLASEREGKTVLHRFTVDSTRKSSSMTDKDEGRDEQEQTQDAHSRHNDGRKRG